MAEESPRDLANKYKRKGLFDSKRKELLSQFTDSATNDNTMTHTSPNNNESSRPNLDDSPSTNGKLNALLEKLIDLKVQKDPSILTKNKGRLVALIQTSLINEQFKYQKQQQGKSRAYNSTSQNGKLAGGDNNKSIDEEEQDVIVEINKLLNKYVDKKVDLNEDLTNEIGRELNLLKEVRDTKNV